VDTDGAPPRECLADRTHRHNDVTRAAVFAALTTDLSWWIGLQPGEVEPRVLDHDGQGHIVWSSFWPVSPNDTIEFDLTSDRTATLVRFRWYSDQPPDERGVAISRQRLNLKFGGNLRGALASDRY
jgi:hypothetical protein